LAVPIIGAVGFTISFFFAAVISICLGRQSKALSRRDLQHRALYLIVPFAITGAFACFVVLTFLQ
jgi:hypothetical protein